MVFGRRWSTILNRRSFCLWHVLSLSLVIFKYLSSSILSVPDVQCLLSLFWGAQFPKEDWLRSFIRGLIIWLIYWLLLISSWIWMALTKILVLLSHDWIPFIKGLIINILTSCLVLIISIMVDSLRWICQWWISLIYLLI